MNKSKQQNKFAIIYQSLYLANLLLAPLFCFIILIHYLAQLKKAQSKKVQLTDARFSRFNKVHLIRSIQLSVLAGVLLGISPALYLLLSDQFDVSVMVMILYFIILHVGFVLLGMLNLARAMAGKLPIF